MALAIDQYSQATDCSADGETVLFHRSEATENAEFSLYTIPIAGGDVTRLTAEDSWEFGPTYSPDGSRIAYLSNREGNFEIYVMAASGEGGEPSRLTTTDQGEGGLSWSADGTTLLYNLNSGTSDIVQIDVAPMLP